MESVQEQTPREMELAIKGTRGRTQSAVDALYAARTEYLDELRLRGEVTLEDVRNLDRLGRCVVASEMLLDCTEEAVEALLNDEHHAVRSCAVLSAQSTAVTLH